MRGPVKGQVCLNDQCPLYGKKGEANVKRDGFIKRRRGKTQRYRCKTCRKGFCSSRGTPYHRIQHSRKTFDQAAAMSVEGVSKSSIARILSISWNTAARWEERAAAAAKSFNKTMMQGYDLDEIQADEIRTFSGGKADVTWVFAAISVWPRLWISTVVGRRSYTKTRTLLRNTIQAGEFTDPPLVTTDGFEYYARVMRELFPNACIHGQVIKEWRQNRVGRITRSLSAGTPCQLEEALANSEDSEKLNTSFIERLNLTIRQGSSYLRRRSPCHSRRSERLEDQLELLRCYYNFMRPHRSLKFGKVTRTPAMQAGLESRRLSFRMLFLAGAGVFVLVLIVIDFGGCIARELALKKAA
jgi:transposase-like protein/IS1 family transposase